MRELHQQIAEQLLVAAREQSPIAPVTAEHPELTVEDAYAIQQLQVERWRTEGRSILGWKVGLTSHAMRRALGVDEPDYGCLLDDMFALSGVETSTARFIEPRIEPEIAFVLGADLRGPVSYAGAAVAVAYALPALEIVDSRIEGWKIGLVDTIADNGSSAAIVLGGNLRRIDELDLDLIGCNLAVNGQTVATGASGAVLGHPLTALTWLTNTLGHRGVALEAGQIVLSGGCTEAVPVMPGDTVTADFAELGSVTAVFAKQEQP